MAEKIFTLSEIAQVLGASLKGDPEIRITGIGTLENAGPGQLSFMLHARYSRHLHQCKASAIIVPPSLQHIDHNLLVVAHPYLALAKAAQLFVELPHIDPGVHPRAHIEEGVELAGGVSIGPLAHVGGGCKIGARSRIYGGVYLGRGVVIGEDCLIYPNVTIMDRCLIGNRVIIQSGAVIGGDGFGFAQDERGRHVKIPQSGIVQIDDDVEIGANCTVDRAAFDRTWIRRGAKIDNLVMIAHNVVVGEDSVLVAQVGISGSTKIGRHVVMAGQVGVAGHLEIGDRVRVGAKSGIAHSVKPGQDVVGIPAVPQSEWVRNYANMKRFPKIREELEQLKKKVRQLEQAVHGE